MGGVMEACEVEPIRYARAAEILVQL